MRTIVFFPGRFQLPHRGHKGVYDALCATFGGNNVYVTMTDTVEPSKSPFTFEERRALLTFAGIPKDKILKVKRNYNLQEVAPQLSNFDMNKDAVIFVVGKKDMMDDSRFNKFMKKDGSPSYLQPYPQNIAGVEPAVRHGYLFEAPVVKFVVLNKTAQSASEMRRLYSTIEPKFKKKFILDLYGKYHPTVEKILDSKLLDLTIQEIINIDSNESMLMELKSALKKIIQKILTEQMGNVEDKPNTKQHNVKAADELIKAAKEKVKFYKEKQTEALSVLKMAQDKAKMEKTPESIEAVNAAKESLEKIKEEEEAAVNMLKAREKQKTGAQQGAEI